MSFAMVISSQYHLFKVIVCILTAAFFYGCAIATFVGQTIPSWKQLNNMAPPMLYTSRYILMYSVGLFMAQVSLATEYMYFLSQCLEIHNENYTIDIFNFYTRFFDKLAITGSLISGWCIISYYIRLIGGELIKRNIYCLIEAGCTFLYCALLTALISSTSPVRYLTNLEVEMMVLEVILILCLLVIYWLLDLIFKIRKNYQKTTDLSYSSLLSRTLEKNLQSLERKSEDHIYTLFLTLCFLFSHGLLVFVPRVLVNPTTGVGLLILMEIFYSRLLVKSSEIVIKNLLSIKR